jgi:adenine-specific DNA-methyltransferase
MIKYLGSKRTLVPSLGKIAQALEASTALDLFTGTTRVAQEFKRLGLTVTASDIATYSDVLAKCYIETDRLTVDKDGLAEVIEDLNQTPGVRGYFTKTFCEASRFFHPKNGAKVDAIRDRLDTEYRDSALYPVLLTSLMLAADRVDSTCGLQMAYLKQWAPRALNDLELRVPELLPGSGRSILGDASRVVDTLPGLDLAYLDPPYNGHRFYSNYHVWETLIRWDEPEHYGVACKRIDNRSEETKSVFNRKREMPTAFMDVIHRVKARTLVVSYNNESWVQPAEIMSAIREAGYEEVAMLAFDYKRYVGAQIGIFNPSGEKVGKVSHVRNFEYVFVAGDHEHVEAAKRATNVTEPLVHAV